MDNKLLCTEGVATLAKNKQGGYVGTTAIFNTYGLTGSEALNIANAERIVTAWNSHDELVKQLGLMTYLVKLKYGNLDKDVYAQIEESENLINSLTTKP